MVDLTAMASALASLNAAKDIAKAMIGLRDASAFQSKMIEFQSKILDAQSSAFAANDERTALVERVGELEEEVARLKAWDAEKQKYKLTEVCVGAFAYVPKPDAGSTEPVHWLCASCYQDGKKSLLQDQGHVPGEERTTRYGCPKCKAVIHVWSSISPRQPWNEQL